MYFSVEKDKQTPHIPSIIPLRPFLHTVKNDSGANDTGETLEKLAVAKQTLSWPIAKDYASLASHDHESQPLIVLNEERKRK